MILGIDPGGNGGICLMNLNGEIVKYNKLHPKGFDDINSIKILLEEYMTTDVSHIFLEDVHAMRNVQASATFGLGFACGFIRAICLISEIEIKMIQPKEWQKIVWIEKDMVREPTKRKKKDGSFVMKTLTKETSLNSARRIWPNETFFATKRSYTPHDGIIDSCLIALAGTKIIQK